MTLIEWPSGESEMARQVREFEWDSSSLGLASTWPQSLRTIVELVLPSSFPMVILWGPDLIQIYNDGYREIMGDKHPSGLGQATAECWPEVWHINQPIYDRVFNGESIKFDDALYPIWRSGILEDAWFTLGYSALRDESSDVVGVLVTVVETTARMQAWKRQETAEALLRQAREQSRAPLEGVVQANWETDASGAMIDSPSWRIYTGQDVTAWLGDGWLTAVHPDDRDHASAQWRDATARLKLVDADFRLWHEASGVWRWTNMRAAPLLDETGRLLRWIGMNIDIHSRKTAEQVADERNAALRDREERLQLLVAELQHRVRNILTLVRSVFSRSAGVSGDLETLVDHFGGRLAALARTQVVVTQHPEGLADLESLIRDELLSVAVSESPRVVLQGPDVALPSKVAELIGLAVHELATNAVKYGALKTAGGVLRVTWSLSEDEAAGALRLHWVETGVPMLVDARRREGFGRELIERALPYQLGATTAFDLKGGGLDCKIDVPLPSASLSVAA